jgi:CheY-like chemotaxis protein
MAERPTVLLLEDEALIAANTAECLEDEGFSVIVTSTPAEALKATSGPALSAIFLDINVADETTGFEVAQAIRRQWPGIPVLYTSGGRPDDFESCAVPGARFIGKPYRLREIADMLREMIGDRGDTWDEAEEPPRLFG